MPDARTIWKQRVASWRASGETAERFSAGRGWSPKTLRWWASQLRREASPAPIVRVAHLVRSPSAERAPAAGAIIIEGLDARVRITVEPGADREMLGTVLALLRQGPT